MQYQKHFSIAEAQAELRIVMPLIQKLAELKKILDARGYDIYHHQYFGGMGPNGYGVFPREMEELVEIIRDLAERGIEVKDPGKGLIDFPHIRANGDEVYLCYILGEHEIVAWHPLEGGFAARKSINEL
ncbi:MAG: DUF2203 family protein [bacterium]